MKGRVRVRVRVRDRAACVQVCCVQVEVTRLVQEKNASVCAFKDLCALKCRATDDAVD